MEIGTINIFKTDSSTWVQVLINFYKKYSFSALFENSQQFGIYLFILFDFIARNVFFQFVMNCTDLVNTVNSVDILSFKSHSGEYRSYSVII